MQNSKPEVFIPETFGRLTTVGPKFYGPKGTNKQRRAYQNCICACNPAKIIAVRVDSLITGRAKSCGCVSREKLSIMGKAWETHGDSYTREYRIWVHIKARCCNTKHKSYKNYGGRGIRVCDRWQGPQGYANFLMDMGRRPSVKHSLDRINNDGNYELSNCRWATTKEQARNKRSTRMLTLFGKTQCLADWAMEYSICKAVVRGRLSSGWDILRALTTPVRACKTNAK